MVEIMMALIVVGVPGNPASIAAALGAEFLVRLMIATPFCLYGSIDPPRDKFQRGLRCRCYRQDNPCTTG